MKGETKNDALYVIRGNKTRRLIMCISRTREIFRGHSLGEIIAIRKKNSMADDLLASAPNPRQV